jgi:hypothetical protein
VNRTTAHRLANSKDLLVPASVRCYKHSELK